MSHNNARELSFQFFYHLQLPLFNDLKEAGPGQDWDAIFNEKISDVSEMTDLKLDSKSAPYLKEMIELALFDEESIEKAIGPHLQKSIRKLSRVDHTLLILAVAELKLAKTPWKVVLNEFIELAKRYGNKDSSSLINAVLDAYCKREGLK